jgi:hypothetical protein
VSPELHRGNQGLDLAFRGTGTNAGRFATFEAKGGFTQTGLSSLAKDTLGIRQGSQRFIETRLDRYGRFGDGANLTTARQLEAALLGGKLDSFASFYGGRSAYKLPLSGNAVRPAVKQ